MRTLRVGNRHARLRFSVSEQVQHMEARWDSVFGEDSRFERMLLGMVAARLVSKVKGSRVLVERKTGRRVSAPATARLVASYLEDIAEFMPPGARPGDAPRRVAPAPRR